MENEIPDYLKGLDFENTKGSSGVPVEGTITPTQEHLQRAGGRIAKATGTDSMTTEQVASRNVELMGRLDELANRQRSDAAQRQPVAGGAMSDTNAAIDARVAQGDKSRERLGYKQVGPDRGSLGRPVRTAKRF